MNKEDVLTAYTVVLEMQETLKDNDEWNDFQTVTYALWQKYKELIEKRKCGK